MNTSEKSTILVLIGCLIGGLLFIIRDNNREIEAMDYRYFKGFYEVHPNLKAQFLEVMKDKKVTKWEFHSIVRDCNKDTRRSVNGDSIKTILFNLR